MRSAFSSVFALGAIFALTACGGGRPAGFTATLPPPPLSPKAVKANDGTIFSAANGYAPLHYGQRAYKVGDMLTIILVENTRTSKSASGNSERDGSIAITPPSTGPFSFDPGKLNSGGGSSFNGQGDAAQTSTLNGDITVTIAEVLSGNIVRVQGEKVMTLSQGQEWVQVSGLVRLSDIDADNRIVSSRIADARLTYSGRGSVQRAGREGWLNRFFNMVSPF